MALGFLGAAGVGEFWAFVLDPDGSTFCTLRRFGNLHLEWRSTWHLIVPGRFGGTGNTDLLFYDRSGTVGEGEFYAVDHGEIQQIGATHTNWRPTWDVIVRNHSGSSC
jgi:hypothetical protein